MKKYILADSYVTRVAANPIDVYINYSNNDNKIFENIHDLNESLLISSPSLYNDLKFKDNINDKQKMAIRKYFIRSCTRTTPFGTLSGVNINSFQKNNENEYKNKKFIRPDSEWLYKIIKNLEAKIGNDIYLIWNNTLKFDGNKILNLWTSFLYSLKNKNNIISINNTKAVKIIEKNTRKYTKFSKLIKILSNSYEQVNEEIFYDFINTLIRKEYLISDLRLPLVNINQFVYILNIINKNYSHIKEVKIILNNLENIKKYMDTYERNIENGAKILEKIVTCMRELCENANYIQVDMRKSVNKSIINKEDLSDDLNRLIQFLLETANFEKDINVINFTNKFVDKFGYRLVKLSTVIDEVQGIGMIDLKNNNFNEESSLLADILENSNISDEISLVNKIKNKLIEEDITKYPRELEIACYPIKNGKGSLEYIISPLIGTCDIGRSSGRFMYMFDEAIIKHIQDSKFNSENFESVEISFIPKVGKVGNVLNCGSLNKYQFNYGCKSDKGNEIDINDIYIGVNREGIYLYSKNLNKEIKFKMNNMTNREYAPQLIQMLIKLSGTDEYGIYDIFKKIHSYTSYCKKFPRIKYKNFILYPSQWNLNKEDFNLTNFISFKNNINSTIEKYKIPKYVFLQKNDQRLLLNIMNVTHLEILFYELKKKQKIKLIENNFNKDNLIYLDNFGGKYLAENIFMLKLNEKYKAKRSIKNNLYVEKVPLEIRYKAPFKEWIFIEIDTYKELEEELLIEYISKFYFRISNLVEKFFYIRYKNGTHNIRMRFKLNKNSDLSEIINEWVCIFDEIKDNNIALKYRYETYEREIERYGGIELIEKAESLFFKDSVCAIEYLKLLQKDEIELDKYELISFTIIKLLYDMGISYNNQLKFFDDFVDRNKYKEYFNKRRKKMINIVDYENDWEKIKNIYFGEDILKITNEISGTAKEYYDLLEKIELKNKLTNTREDILKSIIHMHCNRFLGIDREEEVKTTALVRNILYSFIGYKKGIKKNDK